MADNTSGITQPVQGDTIETRELAVGAADSTTATVTDTGLESGMRVITTPQGKASVDKNAPDFVTEAFNAPDAGGITVPQFDESGKRIIGSVVLRGDPAKNKGCFIAAHSMVTTGDGRSYVSGQFISPKDITDEDRDLLLERGAIIKN